MRIAILGGGRFIGPAIVETLVAAGHEVIAINRGRHPAPDSAMNRMADRRDEAAIQRVLSEIRPQALIDTCAYCRADAIRLRSALPRETHLVLLSSMDVYRAFASVQTDAAALDAIPLTEESTLRPQRYPFRGTEKRKDRAADPETYDKLDVEDELGGRAVTLRLPMVFGERDTVRREEFVLRRVRAGRRRIPIGAGTFLWTRGYVRDVARACEIAARERDLRGEVFNLGERQTWTVEQWMREILGVAEHPAELVRVADEELPGDLFLTRSIAQPLLMSSARWASAVGQDFSEPREALAQSVRWHLRHPPPEGPGDFLEDERALVHG